MSLIHSFGWHINKCPWASMRETGQLIRPYVNHVRVAHVSDFSNQKGGEEDVLGCQVSVDD